MTNELELGKRYTWKKVQEVYSDKWVRMNDCTLGCGDSIIDGIFAGVYADDAGDADDVWLEVLHGRHNGTAKYDRFRRTTIGMGLGFIECLNAKMEVRDEP